MLPSLSICECKTNKSWNGKKCLYECVCAWMNTACSRKCSVRVEKHHMSTRPLGDSILGLAKILTPSCSLMHPWEYEHV